MTPQQIARVVEQTARAGGLNGLLQHGDREVRLADAGLSLEEQARRDVWKRVGDAPRLRDRALERFVVRREVAERAVLVALRNVGVGETLAADVVAPAVAAHHPADAANTLIDRLPAGIVTERAGHFS